MRRVKWWIATALYCRECLRFRFEPGHLRHSRTNRASGQMMPRLLDCRKIGGGMSSLSYTPRDGGLTGSVAAHEGSKPNDGDYLALDHPNGGMALYRCVKVDWCMNVDPANMWMADVEFIPGKVARTLTDLPEDFYRPEVQR